MHIMNSNLGNTSDDLKKVIGEHPIVSILLVGSLVWFFFGPNPLTDKEIKELLDKWKSPDLLKLMDETSEESAKVWEDHAKMVTSMIKRTSSKEQKEQLKAQAKKDLQIARIIRHKLKGKKDV